MWQRSRFNAAAVVADASMLQADAAAEAAAEAEKDAALIRDERDSMLDASPLGTKAYWDSVYQREVGLHAETGDPGEVWFGEAVTEAMAHWVVDLLADIIGPSAVARGSSADAVTAQLERATLSEALSGARLTDECLAAQLDALQLQTRVLELGCGNGTLLLALVRLGVDQRLLSGCDYSRDAIALARDVAAAAGAPDILYFQQDIADMALPGFDVILDKGTFDAIALHADRSLFYAYPAIVARHLRTASSRFVITSCNFTADELDNLFAPVLKRRETYRHQQQFTYGGASGSTVCTVAFGVPKTQQQL